MCNVDEADVVKLTEDGRFHRRDVGIAESKVACEGDNWAMPLRRARLATVSHESQNTFGRRDMQLCIDAAARAVGCGAMNRVKQSVGLERMIQQQVVDRGITDERVLSALRAV